MNVNTGRTLACLLEPQLLMLGFTPFDTIAPYTAIRSGAYTATRAGSERARLFVFVYTDGLVRVKRDIELYRQHLSGSPVDDIIDTIIRAVEVVDAESH